MCGRSWLSAKNQTGSVVVRLAFPLPVVSRLSRSRSRRGSWRLMRSNIWTRSSSPTGTWSASTRVFC